MQELHYPKTDVISGSIFPHRVWLHRESSRERDGMLPLLAVLLA
jgi:hypothetical protein